VLLADASPYRGRAVVTFLKQPRDVTSTLRQDFHTFSMACRGNRDRKETAQGAKAA
jgi:hypothetical protein